jgi:protein involved in polysaccharide export with SLBB domain
VSQRYWHGGGKQVRKFLSSIWVVSILAAAATWAQSPDTPAVTHDKTSAQHADTEPYRIRIQDELAITVWKERELSGSVVVRPEGTITLPLVGEVRVVGLTSQELAELITEKLKSFVSSPQVTVTVQGIGVEQPADPRKLRMLPPERPRHELLPSLWPFVVAETRTR